MSWSFSAIGRAEKIAEAMDAHSEKLTGQSRTEFDAVKLCLQALVKRNFVSESAKARGYSEQLVKIEVSGSDSFVNGDPATGQCVVKIEPIYGSILV